MANQIKIERKKAKLTQTELAKKINVSLRTIQRIEKNEKVLTVEEAFDISEALAIDPIQFIANYQNELTNRTVLLALGFSL